MATKGYQSYHGRMPGWKKLLIGVLLLILIAAVGFLFLQKYQVFDQDGAHFRLPWAGQAQADPSAEEELDDDDVIVDVQEPVSVLEELRGRTLPAETLAEEDFASLQEGERPVLTMKAANGVFLAGNDAAADMVREKIAGRDAVARISCFADTQQADEENGMALMSVSGRAWRDPEGNSWLDPYSADAAAYLVDIIRTCADLGFTEIVLDDVQFPNYGRLDRITFDGGTDTPETRRQAILAFLDTVNEALEDTGVTLSVSLPAELLETGADDEAGWDLSGIAERVDRIYVDAADQAAADAARAALAAAAPEKDSKVFCVAYTAAPITGGSYVIVS